VRGDRAKRATTSGVLDEIAPPPASRMARPELEALARFATGVGRRYMMLLSVVLGRLDVVLDGLPEHDPSRPDLAEAHAAAGQLSELTRMILATGRSSPLQPSIVDLADLLAGVASGIRPILPPTVDLVVDLTPQPSLAFVDAKQLEGGIAELVMNALEAMPNGGMLRLGTQRLEPRGRWPAATDLPTPAGLVAVIVADTGLGMAPRTRHRAEEPFFTTKPGRGVGLGLSAVRGFVEQSGGQFELRSRPGRGTAVRLVFPRSARRPGAR